MADRGDELDAGYEDDPFVQQWTERIETFAKRLSAEFPDYGGDNVEGNSLYIIFYKESNLSDIVSDIMKDNVWSDLDKPRYIHGDEETLYEEFQELADPDNDYDGASAIFMNGRIHEKMLRIRDPDDELKEQARYSNKEGTKHISAAYTAVRDEVLKVITLSGKDGRVTVFEDGEFDEYRRNEDIIPELVENDDEIVDQLIDDGILDQDDIDEIIGD